MVYAVEASAMAHHARALAAANPALGGRIRVLHGKVEDIELPEQARRAAAAAASGRQRLAPAQLPLAGRHPAGSGCCPS